MKNQTLLLALAVFLFAASLSARAQSQTSTPRADAPTVFTRPRVVSPTQTPTPQTRTQQPQQQTRTAPPPSLAPPAAVASPTPAPAPSPNTRPVAPAATTATPAPGSSPVVVPTLAPPAPPVPLQPVRPLAAGKARKAIDDALRLLKSRLQPTASTPNLQFVTLAALDQDSNKTHLLTLPKQTFLTRGLETTLTTSEGMIVRLSVVRPNYVNTAVRVFDLTGRQLTPLVVEYPIEKFGRFREMAYYTSAHPALVTPEVVKAGQAYVRTMLDLAARRLKDKGKTIGPEVVDIAERLCVVEHTDHERFRNDDRAALFNEVYALFGLNELETYRYSVSSAGAGGMVQMIPSTYQMVRRQHPAVGLNPDFVLGMRNHGNALEAMLLYMQDTWGGLALNEDVLEAMRQGWATQPELAAAGYNSNPARLPLYIRRGGASWRYLIPRETQIYLQIYKSFESLVPIKARAKTTP